MTAAVRVGTSMTDLAATAREILDSVAYVVLGTTDPDGSPRLSPVYFTPHDYADLYWVSYPEAQHSQNIERDERVRAVVFDSTVRVGHAEAVYLTGRARRVPDDEVAALAGVAFRTLGGARAMTPDELTGDGGLRLWVLHVEACDVLVRAGHPTLGTGRDRRVAVEL